MSPQDSTRRPSVPASVIAEAAAWLAVLHGPGRTSAAERGFFKWLEASPDHARAFEQATGVWEDSRNLPRPSRYALARSMSRFKGAALATAAVVICAIGGLLFLQSQYAGVATQRGEQRVLTLEDGSHVILNTATRVVVSYDEDARIVELLAGEALFEVTRRRDWPFIVIAGAKQIRALGTAFVVRREEQRVEVTLVEGEVAVTPASDAAQEPQSDAAADASPAARAITLAPGQRLTFDGGGRTQLDRPRLDTVLAWQRREVALDDTPLLQAIAEVNRYSAKPIVLEHPEAAQLHVSGLFRTGDARSFARAVAAAYRLEVVEQADEIQLRGSPHVAEP